VRETPPADQVEEGEFASPAHLQYGPAPVHPTGPGSWDRPRLFATLREAIAAAVTDPDSPAGVAWILTSGGHILRTVEIETLWLRPETAGNPRPPRAPPPPNEVLSRPGTPPPPRASPGALPSASRAFCLGPRAA